MLLKTQVVETTWAPNNRKHFEERGYTFPGYNHFVHVQVSDLPENAHAKVDVQCPDCKREYKIPYRNYVNRKTPMCRSCWMHNGLGKASKARHAAPKDRSLREPIVIEERIPAAPASQKPPDGVKYRFYEVVKEEVEAPKKSRRAAVHRAEGYPLSLVVVGIAHDGSLIGEVQVDNGRKRVKLVVEDEPQKIDFKHIVDSLF